MHLIQIYNLIVKIIDNSYGTPGVGIHAEHTQKEGMYVQACWNELVNTLT